MQSKRPNEVGRTELGGADGVSWCEYGATSSVTFGKGGDRRRESGQRGRKRCMGSSCVVLGGKSGQAGKLAAFAQTLTKLRGNTTVS